jgi:hypothetical protein
MAALEGGVWAYLRTRKRYWLLPLVVVFALFALLVIAGSGSEGDFVYTLD